MKEVSAYPGCFVCGQQNVNGLQARFYFDGQQASCRLTADQRFEGYRGMYHGGIISAVLDEVMIKAILAQDRLAVTAELTVRFLEPVPTGAELIFTGQIEREKGKLVVTTGELRDTTGTRYAEASGKYILAGPDLAEELQKSLD